MTQSRLILWNCSYPAFVSLHMCLFLCLLILCFNNDLMYSQQVNLMHNSESECMLCQRCSFSIYLRCSGLTAKADSDKGCKLWLNKNQSFGHQFKSLFIDCPKGANFQLSNLSQPHTRDTGRIELTIESRVKCAPYILSFLCGCNAMPYYYYFCF